MGTITLVQIRPWVWLKWYVQDQAVHVGVATIVGIRLWVRAVILVRIRLCVVKSVEVRLWV